MVFDRYKLHIKQIKARLVNDFEVANKKYILKGIITCPTTGHFTGILIKVKDDNEFMTKGKNYNYDDFNNNN